MVKEEVAMFRVLLVPGSTANGPRKKKKSCRRVLTGFCASEVGLHRTYRRPPASRKIGRLVDRAAPP